VILSRTIFGGGWISTWSVLLSLLFLGCSDEPPDFIVDPVIDAIEPQLEIILPGSQFKLRGSGFIKPPLGTMRVVFDGQMGGFQTLFAVEALVEDSQTMFVTLNQTAFSLFPTATGTFYGTMQAESLLAIGGELQSGKIPISFVVSNSLWPDTQFPMNTVGQPGARIPIPGSGFLLGDEGNTVALISGEFSSESGENLHLDKAPVLLEVENRNLANLRLGADVFGIEPGTFFGELSLQNEHSTGVVTNSLNPIPAQLSFIRSMVSFVSPASVRRGQALRFDGQGFLASDPEQGVATLMLLDGTFFRSDGGIDDHTGVNALILFPDEIAEDNQMSVTLRGNAMSGDEEFGVIPGSFSGLATPWLIAGDDNVFGTATSVQISVLPARQVVYIKVLPGFDDSLEEFGLLAVKDAVLARTLHVVHRDYAGINVEFRLERPEDYVDYTVVEVGGSDPNGANLLGLDNTEGKDVGNIRFNDVIGGFNALSEKQGYYAYGGVFVRSFFQFSQKHPLGDNEMSNVRFDDIFSPVAPVLGGDPAGPFDNHPSQRNGVVFLAVQVLGSLIGNTVTHEVGHALGLANIEGRFHNEGDNPNWIMDAGIFRPFEERAEIDGQGPAHFSPTNRAYLENILPPDGQ